MPEPNRADMAIFREQIRTVLPVLGLDFLRDRPMPSSAASESAEPERQPSPRFVAEVLRFGIKALGQEIDGGVLRS